MNESHPICSHLLAAAKMRLSLVRVCLSLAMPSKKPQGVFIRPDLVLAVYVGSIRMIGRSKNVIKDFKSQLSKKFNTKDIGKALDYLGIEIPRNRAVGTLKIR